VPAMLKASSRPDWHERPLIKIALRLAGLVLLGCAWWAGSTLLRKYGGMREHPPLEYLLAVVAVVCAVAGAALTIMGHHLFDQVEVAARWGRSSLRIEPLHREDSGGGDD